MKILIAHNTTIPVHAYGGTERIIWWLGRELVKKGHEVNYLVRRGSRSSFAKIFELIPNTPLINQVPKETDLVHLFFQPKSPLDKPYLVTNQGNVPDRQKLVPLDQNTVFVSRNHAQRHAAECYVYNGIDPDDYITPDLGRKRNYFHFLAKGTWRAKNLRGAIDIARRSNHKLRVMGSGKLSIDGLRYFYDRKITFHGMTGGAEKNNILNGSRGLLFPVLWNEPFGIAMIESLYFGCPVFGTPYGSLPEIIREDVGFLSNSLSALSEAVSTGHFNPQFCHHYILENFTSSLMTRRYLELYQRVIDGEKLNSHPPVASGTIGEKFPASLLP